MDQAIAFAHYQQTLMTVGYSRYWIFLNKPNMELNDKQPFFENWLKSMNFAISSTLQARIDNIRHEIFSETMVFCRWTNSNC